MVYIVGISSGIFGAAPQQEKIQYLGISSKVNYCMTQGVTFTQIDIETMSEFKDPKINIENDEKREAWKKKIKDMNISLGFHGESQAMGGREIPMKFDSAIGDDYARSHQRLIEVLENAGKLGSKYYLLHSSESTPFILLGKTLDPTNLVDFWGRPLDEFIKNEKLTDDKTVMDWIWDSDFMWVEMFNDTPEKIIQDQIKQRKRAAAEEKYEFTEESEKRIREQMKELLWDRFFTYIKSRSLHYGPERYAYYIIAKWMEAHEHELWKKITISEWSRYKEKNKVREDIPPSIDEKEFRESQDGMQVWVPAVAAIYIWGHLNPEKCPDEKYRGKDPKKILEKYQMHFVIETPMAQAGQENLMRLSDPVHMCHLAQYTNFKYFRVAIDFEHVLSNYINPEEMIERMDEKHGSLIKVVHLGWPTPVIPAHMPIHLGSEQHKWIYQRLWELRQKGFTDEEDRYMIYERGSSKIEQSILAMRLIVEFLEKNTNPEKLPLKFFGIEGPSPATMQRQKTIIQEHARDPIEGLLVVPEETYTFLGKAGTEKAGAEKWKKEELS